MLGLYFFFFFSSRRRHTRCSRDWSSDVCSSDLWMDADVFERLRSKNLALCIADSEKFSTPVEITASYGYFRLRDEGYTPEDLGRWAETIRTRAAACADVFVYFKHEEAGIGPQFARMLLGALSGAP